MGSGCVEVATGLIPTGLPSLTITGHGPSVIGALIGVTRLSLAVRLDGVVAVVEVGDSELPQRPDVGLDRVRSSTWSSLRSLIPRLISARAESLASSL